MLSSRLYFYREVFMCVRFSRQPTSSHLTSPHLIHTNTSSLRYYIFLTYYSLHVTFFILPPSHFTQSLSSSLPFPSPSFYPLQDNPHVDLSINLGTARLWTFLPPFFFPSPFSLSSSVTVVDTIQVDSQTQSPGVAFGEKSWSMALEIWLFFSVLISAMLVVYCVCFFLVY